MNSKQHLQSIEDFWLACQDHLGTVFASVLPTAFFATAVSGLLSPVLGFELATLVGVCGGFSVEAGAVKSIKLWYQGMTGSVWLVLLWVAIAIMSVGVKVFDIDDLSGQITYGLLGAVGYMAAFLAYSSNGSRQAIIQGELDADDRELRDYGKRLKKAVMKAEAKKDISEINNSGETFPKVSESFPATETLPINLRQLRKMPKHIGKVKAMTVDEISAYYKVHPRTAKVWKEEYSNES